MLNSVHMLQTHVPGTFLVIIFILMRFFFDSLSRAFSNQCVFDENTWHISVDRRPTSIAMYTFSSENAFSVNGTLIRCATPTPVLTR